VARMEQPASPDTAHPLFSAEKTARKGHSGQTPWYPPLRYALVYLRHLIRTAIQFFQGLDDIPALQLSTGQVAGELAPDLGICGEHALQKWLRLLGHQNQSMSVYEATQ